MFSRNKPFYASYDKDLQERNVEDMNGSASVTMEIWQLKMHYCGV